MAQVEIIAANLKDKNNNITIANNNIWFVNYNL